MTSQVAISGWRYARDGRLAWGGRKRPGCGVVMISIVRAPKAWWSGV